MTFRRAYNLRKLLLFKENGKTVVCTAACYYQMHYIITTDWNRPPSNGRERSWLRIFRNFPEFSRIFTNWEMPVLGKRWLHNWPPSADQDKWVNERCSSMTMEDGVRCWFHQRIRKMAQTHAHFTDTCTHLCNFIAKFSTISATK